MLKLTLNLDIRDPDTGEMMNPELVRAAWFRRHGQYPSLADTIGELMLSTGLSVALVDDQGNEHPVIVQTSSYATMVVVTRGMPKPFGELAIMSDSFTEEDETDEIIDLTEEVQFI